MSGTHQFLSSEAGEGDRAPQASGEGANPAPEGFAPPPSLRDGHPSHASRGEELELSEDRARLDIARIHGWLANTYWSPGIARDLVERAIANSEVVGAYVDGDQVGFARLVTDRATFAYLADVYVSEQARGLGLGRAMTRFFLDRPDLQGLRRWMLATADAHGVYAAVGFQPLEKPDRYMEIYTGPPRT